MQLWGSRVGKKAMSHIVVNVETLAIIVLCYFITCKLLYVNRDCLFGFLIYSASYNHAV